MPGTNEAFSRVKIDAQLKDQGWDVLDPNAVRFEYVLPDRTKADYVLCDRHGRALAVIEAKKAAINPAEAEAQARAYAAQLDVPNVFLANGEEIRFWEWRREAFPRAIRTFFSQGDLERRAATGQVRRDPLTVAIDRRIVERDYQVECVDTLCREVSAGRRKLLVEMGRRGSVDHRSAELRSRQGRRVIPRPAFKGFLQGRRTARSAREPAVGGSVSPAPFWRGRPASTLS